MTNFQLGKSILFGIVLRYAFLLIIAISALSIASDDTTPIGASKSARIFFFLFGLFFGVGVLLVGYLDVSKHLDMADKEIERHQALTAQMLPPVVPQPSPLEITHTIDTGVEGIGSTRKRMFTATDPAPAKPWIEYICTEHGKTGRLPGERDLVAANRWGAQQHNRWYDIIDEDGFTEWVGDGPTTGRRLKAGMGQGDLQRYYGHWPPVESAAVASEGAATHAPAPEWLDVKTAA